MTIGNALSFIKRGLNDDLLRKRLNMASGIEGMEEVLADENLKFSYGEFDEAYHHRLVQCQEEHEADQIKEFKMWWDLLTQIESGRTCGGCNVSK